MNMLEEAREDIDEIDARMAELFVRRMEASSRVLEYKRKNGLPIFDPEREGAVIERGLERVSNSALKEHYRSFIVAVMDISKAYQRELLEENRDI